MRNLLSKVLVVLALLLCSCRGFMYSHNGSLVGKGKYFNVGAGEYGITYVDGLFAVHGVRENSELEIETSDGDSFANPTSEISGRVVIRFRTGPQVTGYLVDIARLDADAAKEYVGQMGELNKRKGETKDGE